MGKRVLTKFIPGALRFQVRSGHQPSRASLINITCPASRIRGRHPFCIAVFITFLSRSRGTSKAAPPFWTHLHRRVDIIWSFSFRFLLYSLFLRPFGLRSVTIFKPYEKTSMPLTEPDLQISSIRLFSLTHLAPDNVKLCTILGLGNG